MKVENSKTVSSVNKKKKASSSSSAASGVSFEEMVQAAQGVESVEKTAAASAVSSVEGVESGGGGAPKNARDRGHSLLDALEDLEQEVLSGGGHAAVARIKEVLATKAMDADDLPERLKEILEEIELRAEVEIAKAEES